MDQRINGRAQTTATQEESIIDYRVKKQREWLRTNSARLRREFWARKAEA